MELNLPRRNFINTQRNFFFYFYLEQSGDKMDSRSKRIGDNLAGMKRDGNEVYGSAGVAIVKADLNSLRYATNEDVRQQAFDRLRIAVEKDGIASRSKEARDEIKEGLFDTIRFPVDPSLPVNAERDYAIEKAARELIVHAMTEGRPGVSQEMVVRTVEWAKSEPLDSRPREILEEADKRIEGVEGREYTAKRFAIRNYGLARTSRKVLDREIEIEHDRTFIADIRRAFVSSDGPTT